jgi:hypothetical protein
MDENLIMKSTKQLLANKLCEELKPLSQACPLPPCNPDCPMHQLRNMLAKPRLRWLATLSEEDLKFLAAYHHVCAKTTLESQCLISNG